MNKIKILLTIIPLLHPMFSLANSQRSNDTAILQTEPSRDDPLIRTVPIQIKEKQYIIDQKKSSSQGVEHHIDLSINKHLIRGVAIEFPKTQTGDSITISISVGRQSSDSTDIVYKQKKLFQPKLDIEFIARYARQIHIKINGLSKNNQPDVQLFGVLLSSATRIMIIGNSIAAGKFADNLEGFRHKLYDYLIAHNENVDFVGPFGTPPYEGHYEGGRRIDDFYPWGLGRSDVTPSMNNYQPNIVIIHLGTNDINIESTPISPYSSGSGFADTQTGEMGQLVDYLLRWHNGTYATSLDHIIVSQIIPMYPDKDVKVVEFNLELHRLIKDFANGSITASPEPVHLVDQYSWIRGHPNIWQDNDLDPLYTPVYPNNDLHPNTEGHIAMAWNYFYKVRKVLNRPLPFFSNITWQAEVQGFDDEFLFQGAAVFDNNHDGYPDLYTTRTAPNSSFNRDAFYSSTGPFPYTESATTTGIADPGQSRGVVFVDIDNDGDADLFNGNSYGRNRLYEKNSGFADMTASANLSNISKVTTGVAAFDADNDGDMDLFALNSRDKNEYYQNNGGVFQAMDNGLLDIVESSIANMSVSVADYDRDGDSDLYITKRYGPNKLFVNNDLGQFTDLAVSAGVDLNHKSNGAVWADMDNDGWQDLLVTVSSTSFDPNPFLHVYGNNQDGTFQDMTQSVAIRMDGYSVVVADFDNDAMLDMMTTNESDSSELYLNQGNWTFTRVDPVGAVIFAGDTRGAIPFDADDDGDIDIFAARVDVFNQLLQNNVQTNNSFLKIKARGPNNNAVGYGTLISLYEPHYLGRPESHMTTREVTSQNGHLTQPLPELHFGTAQQTRVDVMAFFTDNRGLAIRQVDVDQRLSIAPGEPVVSAGMAQIVSARMGNNQTGFTASTLPLPLAVRVTDAVGRPVHRADIRFTITQGDAQLSSGSNNPITAEAEGGTLTGGIKKVADATASDSMFVMAPAHQSSGEMVDLEFNVPESDRFHIWARVQTAGLETVIHGDVDGSDGFQIVSETQTSWQWVPLTDANGDTLIFDLSAGDHQLSVGLDPGPVQLDKLIIQPADTHTPIGVGSSLATNITDRDGVAFTYLTLGDLPGSVKVEAQLVRDGQPVSGTTIEFQATAVLPYVVCEVTTLLEGFMSTADSMTTLETEIPLNSPFPAAPRSVDSIPSNVVDWICVHLISESDILVNSQSVFIRTDGKIVDPDGSTQLVFENVSPADYWIALSHRNHIGIQSRSPYLLGTEPVQVDFTTDISLYQHQNHAVELENGIIAISCGDMNQDGAIDGTDYRIWSQAASIKSTGYLPADLNGDARVTTRDYVMWLNACQRQVVE